MGAKLGLKAGWVLGVLGGLYGALRGGKGGKKLEVERVGKLLQDAKRELGVEGVFEEGLWGGDGVWRFEVVSKGSTASTILDDNTRDDMDGGRGGEEVKIGETTGGDEKRDAEGEVTFEEVAAQHPLVKKWVQILETEARWWGVDLRRFEGEDWEAGRIDG